MREWLRLLRPNGAPFHRSRMFLGALAFSLPMGYLVYQQHLQAAGMIGFAILTTLMLDMGGTRRRRLESMVLGSILILATAGISMYINEHLLLWLLGIVLLISLIGASLTAGYALDLLLRMMAAAYLIGYPGSIVTSAILPIYLAGAAFTIALSIGFAPRISNPVGLKETPHWRNDYQRLRQGQYAGLTFGCLLAFACTFSFFLTQQLGFSAPNIAAICTLMVFRPEPTRTQTTIWQRISGVLLASLLAWLIVFQISNNAVLVALAALCGGLMPVAFASGLPYVAALTTFILYIILALFGLHGHAAQLAAENRIIETLIGAGVATVFAMIYQSLKPSNE